MILGSHNSLSYLKSKHWYTKPFAFTAKCQEVSIKEQYEKYNVRCFDFRIRFNKKGKFLIAHGYYVYDIDLPTFYSILDYLNSKKDCYVRVLHEVRTKGLYTELSKKRFIDICGYMQDVFKDIKFWCGRNLYNWEVDFKFDGKEPTCKELYSSVCSPKIIDDWYPKRYAKHNNKKNLKQSIKEDILLIDFVNIQ